MKYSEPAWPVIIKHRDDDELTYIPDRAEWQRTITSSTYDLDETDLLIDVTGRTFSLDNQDNRGTGLKKREDVKDLQEILGLVKAHAAQAGSCCVAKLYAPSISEAYKIVESTVAD